MAQLSQKYQKALSVPMKKNFSPAEIQGFVGHLISETLTGDMAHPVFEWLWFEVSSSTAQNPTKGKVLLDADTNLMKALQEWCVLREYEYPAAEVPDEVD